MLRFPSHTVRYGNNTSWDTVSQSNSQLIITYTYKKPASLNGAQKLNINPIILKKTWLLHILQDNILLLINQNKPTFFHLARETHYENLFTIQRRWILSMDWKKGRQRGLFIILIWTQWGWYIQQSGQSCSGKGLDRYLSLSWEWGCSCLAASVPPLRRSLSH